MGLRFLGVTPCVLATETWIGPSTLSMSLACSLTEADRRRIETPLLRSHASTSLKVARQSGVLASCSNHLGNAQSPKQYHTPAPYQLDRRGSAQSGGNVVVPSRFAVFSARRNSRRNSLPRTPARPGPPTWSPADLFSITSPHPHPPPPPPLPPPPPPVVNDGKPFRPRAPLEIGSLGSPWENGGECHVPRRSPNTGDVGGPLRVQKKGNVFLRGAPRAWVPFSLSSYVVSRVYPVIHHPKG